MSGAGRCESQPSGGDRVRKPAAAGRFYPAGKEETYKMCDACFREAAAEPAPASAGGGAPLAVIVPHAGYVFSGPVAAAAYGRIDPDRDIERIFLIGPSHYVYMDGASVNTGFDFYRTPLGDVEVDTTLGSKLIAENKVFSCNPEAHDREHCLEVQLPLLQYRLKSMPSIVPIIIGCQNADVIKRVAGALKPYLNERNLFVISSDFSHYPAYDDAVKADKATGDAIAKGSIRDFVKALSENEEEHIPGLETSACGQSAIAALMFMTEDDSSCRYTHLTYRNSGDSEYGDRESCVGYHAFTVTREKAEEGFALTDEEKKSLLTIARRAIENSLNGSRKSGYDGIELSAALKKRCGAFVTLNVGDELRGCIGHFGEDLPLYEVVDGMAREAAFDDPRFSPVDGEEMKDITIEISVLTPMKRIGGPDDFTLGKQGIYMVKEGRGGTFLPQVAEETGWTKEEFLGHCARDKAGIGWDGWKRAELYTYEAVVFKED